MGELLYKGCREVLNINSNTSVYCPVGKHKELLPYLVRRLLENGAKSLSQSWILGALYQKWKRVKGIAPDPEPPDSQSSFLEWEKNVKQQEQTTE